MRGQFQLCNNRQMWRLLLAKGKKERKKERKKKKKRKQKKKKRTRDRQTDRDTETVTERISNVSIITCFYVTHTLTMYRQTADQEGW